METQNKEDPDPYCLRGAPPPPNEPERLRFLHRLDILDTVSEDAFDDITKMLTQLFKVPIALVSLVDDKRQWFKSVQGLSCTETGRESSFCAHLLLPESPEMLLVPDTHLDQRFMKNKLVTEDPKLRFYLGAPIILDGYRLGSLCILDRVPRYSFGEQDARVLASLADVVASLIDKARVQCGQYDMLDNPSFLIDALTPSWPIIYKNRPAKNLEIDAMFFLNTFTLLEDVDLGSISESRTVIALFCDDQHCTCTFYPSMRSGFLGMPNSNHDKIAFPYAEPEPGNVDVEKIKREYVFCVVKFDTSSTADKSLANLERMKECLEAEHGYMEKLKATVADAQQATQSLRSERESAKAKIALLARDLKARRDQQAKDKRSCQWTIPENDVAANTQPPEENQQESGPFAKQLPPYVFRGTVAEFLTPFLLPCKVIIYGGRRAECLESGMRQLGIDAHRPPNAHTARQRPIQAEGRRGRRLAVVDVVDARTEEATLSWFEKVSDALSPGGILVTISVSNELLETVHLIGQGLAWSVEFVSGSRRDYSILVLTKGPDSDELLQAAYGTPQQSEGNQ